MLPIDILYCLCLIQSTDTQAGCHTDVKKVHGRGAGGGGRGRGTQPMTSHSRQGAIIIQMIDSTVASCSHEPIILNPLVFRYLAMPGHSYHMGQILRPDFGLFA